MRKVTTRQRGLLLLALAVVLGVVLWSLFAVVTESATPAPTGEEEARRRARLPGPFRARFHDSRFLSPEGEVVRGELGGWVLGRFRIVRRGGKAWSLARADELTDEALYNLLFGGECGSSVERMLQAAKLEPRVARRWDDAVAGLVECATRAPNGAKRSDYLVRAADLVERRLRIEESEELLFNRALALEELGVWVGAKTSWNAYLEIDSRSAWAVVAQLHLDTVRAHLARQAGWFSDEDGQPLDLAALAGTHPSAARRWSERWLLGWWGEATLEGEEERAETVLGALEEVVALLPREGGRLLAAGAETIRAARQANDDSRLRLLARGHSSYLEALRFSWAEQKVLASEEAARAFDDLQQAGSPFALAARLLILRMDGSSSRLGLELELDRLVEQALSLGLPTLVAEARFLLAARISGEERFDEALSIYQLARDDFEQMREWEAAAVMSAFRAEIFAYRNHRHPALEELALAMELGPEIADGYLRYSIFVGAASVAEQLKLKPAARVLRQEASSICRWIPERPLCAADSWIRLAVLAPTAVVRAAELTQAETALRGFASSEGKTRSMIELDQGWAAWNLADDNPDADLEAALLKRTEAIEGYAQLDLPVLETRERTRRAALLARLGRWEEAREGYRAVLESLRHWGQGGNTANAVLPVLARQAFEGLIGVELELAEGARSLPALLLSEELRGRLAAHGAVPFRPLEEQELEALATRLPPSVAAVEFAVIGDLAVAWLFAEGQIRQISLSLGEEFEEALDEIDDLVNKPSLERWRETTGVVRSALIDPVLAHLPPGVERLVLLPDGELYGVPFRGLWGAKSGSYLDEEFAIVRAPSLRSLGSPARTRIEERGGPTPESEPTPLLALGFGEFPGLNLRELPQAANEAAAVAREYGVLSEDQCPVTDWTSLRACLPLVGVVHFATHAQARSALDGDSWLALKSQKVYLGQLWRELPQLPHTRLVVFSACQSATATPGSEGLGGLARPFLARGVDQVVGSLWPVIDRDAAALFPAFHRYYQQTGEAAEALRRAREELPEWANEPWSWAGVVTVGANLEQ